MATADDVIVEFEARVGKYERDLKRAAATFEKATKRQRSEMARLERQMLRSSTAIGGSLRGLAGTFAAAFGARQIQQLLDGYTKFTNQLRTAGYEGTRLGEVQEKLFVIAQRYGVELESVGTLFGRSAAAARDMNLSLDEQLKIVSATSAALKINGSSASDASGALLQLSQLMGGFKVQAQEYNSLIDGARPLLQAVADGSDKWAGSVNALTRDVKDSKVTVNEFTQALIKGSDAIIARADQATLTIGGAFTVLNNALGKYLGESDASLSLTERLSGAIISLADNIDTVVKAVTVLGAVLLGRYVAGAVAGGLATRALIAHLQIATTSMAGLALASRSAGAAMLGVFGGPVGLAVAALTLGIGYLAVETAKQAAEAERLAGVSQRNEEAFLGEAQAADAATRETEGLSDAQIIARSAALGLSVDTDNLADAHYRAAAAARVQAIEEQKLAAVSASRQASRKAAEVRFGAFAPVVDTFGAVFGRSDPVFSSQQGQEFLNSAEYRAYVRARDTLQAMMDAPIERFAPPAGTGRPAPEDDEKDKKPKKAPAPKGKEADDVTERFERDLARLQAEELSAQADAARNVFERADLQAELLALEATERRRELEREIAQARQDTIDSEKMSAAEKAQTLAFLDDQRTAQAAIIDRLYGVVTEIAENGDIIVTPTDALYPAEVRRELEEELANQARDMLAMEADALDALIDITDSIEQRNQLEQQVLALSQQIQREMLEQAILNGEIADADRARLLLAQQQAAQSEGQRRDQMSPFEAYRADLETQSLNLNNAVEELGVDVLNNFNKELAEAIVNFESLGDVGLAALQSLTQGLVQLAIQQLAMRAISAILGSSATATTSAQAGAAAAAWAPAAALASLATLGANAAPASAALVGTNALAQALAATSIARATGGPIFGLGGPRDDKVLVRASPGEYMIQESAARRLGRETLDHLNATGELPTLPRGMMSAGGARGGMDPSMRRDLLGAVAEAAKAMPPINLYPTMDPGSVLRQALATPGGRQAMFDFVSNNSGRFGASQNQ